MTDYIEILNTCDKASEMNKKIIDDFLIYYAAGKNNVDRHFDKLSARYKHTLKELQPEWVNMLRAQYMCHRIMKQDGLVNQYLKHKEVQELEAELYDYLEEMSKTPWRYSFSILTKELETEFFEMHDVFREETFVLHSPGISDILHKGKQPLLWFNMVGFNGQCWQSYGPITYFSGFEPDDIFFFATELNPLIKSEEDLLEDLEKSGPLYDVDSGN